MTNPETRREAEAIFHDLVGRPPELHAELLDARCGSRAALREEVERLLGATDQVMGEFMRTAARDGLPDRVGRYRIEHQIGEGGMGIVYAARQENPDRAVALKLLRPGLSAGFLVQRFQHEVEALGTLQHPNIAHIYEAGTADVVTIGGRFEQPYFAMELIHGEPLTDHVRGHKLDPRARLLILAQVCDAAQHAHQRGVIHRDLKPANILVDGAGRPKILDFGVARIVNADLETRTQHTTAGQLLGTLAYMSPEQLAGNARRVDTRSDVYALGVIGFELLADRTPCDISGLTIPAAIRTLTDRAPPRLGSVRPELRGDLEAIIEKAMEQDPDRRYGSAAELAADIRRYLRNEPVTARPSSATYLAWKFAQRNKILVGSVASVVAALSLGVVGTTWGVIQMRWQRDLARQQARAVQAANDFLTKDLLGLADPHNEPQRDLPMRVALDRAAEKVGERLSDEPVLQANLRIVIGKAFSHLGLLDKAEPQLARALELYEQARGERDADALVCRMELATIYSQRGQFDRAERIYAELIDIQRSVFGPEHEQTLASQHNLGNIYVQTSRFAEAEPILRQTLAQRLRILGENDKRTAMTMNVLGVLCIYTGRAREAAELLRQSVSIFLRVNGEEHPDTLQAMANLGAAYLTLKETDKAEETLARCYEIHRRVLGDEHRGTLAIAGLLASAYGAQESPQREPLLRETLETQRRVFGENHMDTLLTAVNLAKVAYDRKDYIAAEARYHDLADRWEAAFPGIWNTGVTRFMHGRCLARLRRFGDAEQAYLSAHEQLERVLGPAHTRTRQVVHALIELYDDWQAAEPGRGHDAEAAAWRARAAESPASAPVTAGEESEPARG